MLSQTQKIDTLLKCFWIIVSTLIPIHLPTCTCLDIRTMTRRPSFKTSNLFSSHSSSELPKSNILSVDQAVLSRFACKHFQRFNATVPGLVTATSSDPYIVSQALECINLARLAPSSFNTQPYKIVMVHNPEQKLALSKYCLGPNAQRVQDSDCTAVFLADRKILKSLPRFTKFMTQGNPERKLPRILAIYIAVFSSGYPFPRIISAVISFCFRVAMSTLNVFTKPFKPMPSLSSAETWSTKNVMMVAMTYMLACSSRGIATIPMEGINGPGIRRVLNVPSRYAIPLVVATGTPDKSVNVKSIQDNWQNRRYPREEMIYENQFG